MTTPPASQRNSLIKVMVPLVVILVLVVGGLSYVKSQMGGKHLETQAQEQLAVGKTLPDFVLKRFGPGSIKASELKSKVLLINFWATWCEACMVEMPSIIRLRKHYADRGLGVAEINVDDNPDVALPSVLKKLGIDFPVYVDEGQKLSEAFDVHAIPLTVIVDKNFKVVLIESGERNWNGDDVHSDIEKWLAL
jgi:thiol-disulfide isomerase/thioredoxin